MPGTGGFIGKARLEGGAGHRAVIFPAAGHDGTLHEHPADAHQKLNISSNRVQRDKPLRKIVEILETKIGPAELAAVCRDNAERRFESINELSSFENTNDQKILELEIKTHTKVEGEYFHARLRFLAEEQSVILSEGSKIKLHIDGENELAVALCRELEKKINILRPWYSIYAGLRRSHIFWTITLVIMGAALGLIQLLSNDSPEKQLSVSDTVAASFLVVFIVGVLALACSTALSKFILKLRQGAE